MCFTKLSNKHGKFWKLRLVTVKGRVTREGPRKREAGDTPYPSGWAGFIHGVGKPQVILNCI